MFMLIMSAMLAVITFAFFYSYLKRACKTAELDILDDRSFRAVILLISACFASYFAIEVGFGAIFVLHLIVIALIFKFADFIVKKAGKNIYKNGCKAWKTVYGSGIIPLALALIIVVCGYLNMNIIVRTDYTVYTEKQLRMGGYSIALIADVHYGVSIGDDELNRICAEVSAAEPSLVVLCGDIVDEITSADGMKKVFVALGNIKSEFGVFYVYGNHDRQLYTDAAAFTETELENEIEKNGITVLRDEAYSVNSELTLIGREDLSYRRGSDGVRAEISELAGGVDKDTFILTLDHQPHGYNENAEAGVDLILSGHTHGGQIFPANLLFDLFKLNDLNYGYKRVGNTCQAIVTSGLAGWGFPVKTAAPAEYVIIEVASR